MDEYTLIIKKGENKIFEATILADLSVGCAAADFDDGSFAVIDVDPNYQESISLLLYIFAECYENFLGVDEE